MSDGPEVLKDANGAWCRRDVFVGEVAEENDVDPERVDRILDEMVEEDGVLRTQTVGDDEYVQLTGRMKALKALATYKTRQAKNAATRYLGRGGDDDDDV